MRTNLAEVPKAPLELDEHAVAHGDADAATGNKNRAEEALAFARVRLRDIAASAKTAPRGTALEKILTEQIVAERMIGILEADVVEAEAARVAAVEVLSKIQLERDKVTIAAFVEEHGRNVATATDELTTATKAFAAAILNRGRALALAAQYSDQARLYDLPAARLAPTSEVLATPEVVAALREAGLRLELGNRPALFIA